MWKCVKAHKTTKIEKTFSNKDKSIEKKDRKRII